MDKVIIFDTTLRDGEQSLPFSLSVQDKLRIALQLEKLGVDVIEAGFPVSSKEDFQSVQTIARHIKNATVCGLCRAVENDIDVCAKALSVADKFRIHTFIATSPIHTGTKLRKSYDEVIAMAVKGVKRAKQYTDDVEFSCEDAGRTPIDDLCKMVETVINAGATTVNLPDTVGYTIPGEFANIIKQVFERVPNIDKAVISVHCHNDLGLATGNTISAMQSGARQVEVTMNTTGERAGNASLEEVVMILKTRKDILGLETNINFKEIYPTSKLVSNSFDIPIHPNKAIVGDRAFSHSSGIHQDGVIKGVNVYEIMTPESIGRTPDKLTLTSRSGRAAVKMYMDEMGYKDYDLNELYTKFVDLADKKGQLFDYDLEVLQEAPELFEEPDFFEIKRINILSKEDSASAVALMRCGDELIEASANGEGSISCLYNAIYKATGYDVELKGFDISSKVDNGENSIGKMKIMVEHNGRSFYGTSFSDDVVSSAGKSLVNAMNSIQRLKQIEHMQKQNSKPIVDCSHQDSQLHLEPHQ